MATPAKRARYDDNKALSTAVRNAHWWEVGDILIEGVLSDDQRQLAVLEASKYAHDAGFRDYILPHCSDDQRDSVLTTLVARHMWRSVGTLLKRGVSDEQRRRAVQEASKEADDDDFSTHILPHCSDDQRDSVLTTLVTRRMWVSVGRLLERGVSDEQRRWAVQEACKEADDDDFATYILPHCNDDQQDSVLTTLVKRRMWTFVGTLLELKRGVSDEQRRWAVQEASKYAYGTDFGKYILPHCSDDQRDSVLTTMITRRMWTFVGTLLELERGVSDEQRRWAVQEASKDLSTKDAALVIASYCSDDDVDHMLTTMVTRRMWRSVSRLIERGVSDEQRRWAVQEASKEADDDEFGKYILPHCSDDQLDSVLTTVVTRHMWESVAGLLERGVRDEQRRWAVQEASKDLNGKYAALVIASYCSDDDVGHMLTTLVTKRMWESVDTLLKRGVSDEQIRWAVQEASKGSKCEPDNDDDDYDYDYDDGFDDYVNYDDVGEDDDIDINEFILCTYILPHCSYDQRDSLLTTLVTRRIWWSVGKLLERGVSDVQRRCAVQEASKEAEDDGFNKYILPHCGDDQRDSVLTTLVTRRMWESVGTLLKRGVSDEQRRWAVREATTHASNLQFYYIILLQSLHHCDYDQLDPAVRTVVTHSVWKGVDNQHALTNLHMLLERRQISLSEATVQVASKTCSHSDFFTYIFPHCINDQCMSLLAYFVDHGAWHHVETILQQKQQDMADPEIKLFTDSVRKWNEDFLYCSSMFESAVLSTCTTAQLAVDLQRMVGLGLWDNVALMLKKGADDKMRRWAVEEACRHDDSEHFTEHIFPLCDDDQVGPILLHFVRGAQWEAVDQVLQGEVKAVQRTWTVEQGASTAADADVAQYILHHSDTDQLENLFETLITRHLWLSVDKVLGKGVNDLMLSRAVTAAVQWCTDCELTDHILTHCTAEQLVALFKSLVEKRMWRSVAYVIDKGHVSDQQKILAITEASKVADEEFVLSLLGCCPHNVNDLILSKAVDRGQWSVVAEMLECRVSDHLQRSALEKAWLKDSGYHFLKHIFPYCAGDQVDSVLNTLVERKQWPGVRRVMNHKDCSESAKRVAVGSALKTANGLDLVTHILRHCNDAEVDTLLLSLVDNGQWEAVGHALKQQRVRGKKRKWLLKKSSFKITTAEFSKQVLPYLTDVECELLLTLLVTHKKWQHVEILLSEINSDKQQWAIGQIKQQQSQFFYGSSVFDKYMRSLSTDKLIEEELPYMVEHRHWKAAGKVLRLTSCPEQLQTVILEACMTADDLDLTEFILPNCPKELLESTLTTLVSRGMWRAVELVLQRGVSRSKHVWAFEEAMQHASVSDFADHLLPYCMDDIRDNVAVFLVSNGQWEGVGQLLCVGVSEQQRQHAIEEGSTRADGFHFAEYILPHCINEELQPVLSQLLNRQQWDAVGLILKRGVPTDVHTWAMEHCVKHAANSDLVQYIIPFCGRSQHDLVMAALVTRGLCREDINDVDKRCLLEGASEVIKKRLMDPKDREETLQACHSMNKSKLMLFFTRCRFWDCVSVMLKEGTAEAKVKAALDTAHREKDISVVIDHMAQQHCWSVVGEILRQEESEIKHGLPRHWSRPYGMQTFVENVVPRLASDQSEMLLSELTCRCLWKGAGALLQHGVSETLHTRVILEASLFAGEDDFIDYLVPRCHSGQVETVLQNVCGRGHLRCAGHLVVKEKQDLHSTEQEECKRGGIKQITLHLARKKYWLALAYLLHNMEVDTATKVTNVRLSGASVGEVLDCVLKLLIKHTLWDAFNVVIQHGLGLAIFQSVIEELTDDEIFHRVVPYCPDEHLPTILSQLLSSGFWRSVGYLLQKHIDSHLVNNAVETASNKASDRDFSDYIAVYCGRASADIVMPILLKRNLWQSARTLLQQLGSTPVTRDPAHIFSQLVCLGFWPAVRYMMREGLVSDALKSTAAIKASIETSQDNFISYILPHCSDVVAFDNLVQRGFWLAVSKMLKQNIPHEKRSWAIEQARYSARYDDFQAVARECNITESCHLLHRAENYCNLHEIHKLVRELGWDDTFSTLIMNFVKEKDKDRVVGRHMIFSQSESPLPHAAFIALRDSITRDTAEDCLLYLLSVSPDIERSLGLEHTPVYTMSCFIKFITEFHKYRERQQDERLLFLIVSVVAVFPEVQSVCLGMCLQEKKWGLVNLASVTQVWEQVRRQLFEAAVKQGQWSVVKKFATHALYDDQRHWAMHMASKEHQWDAYVLMAEHTPPYVAHFHLAKFGDRNSVLMALRHGANIRDMKRFLLEARRQNLQHCKACGPSNYTKRVRKLSLIESEHKRRIESEHKRRIESERNRRVSQPSEIHPNICDTVLYAVTHRLPLKNTDSLLQKAVERKWWHVVKCMGKYVLDASQRNTLFTEMVRQQQWAICRELLESGVAVSSCLSALPTLLRHCQWVLVGRIMDLDVGDSVRRDLIQHAVERREGSLVWHCVSTLRQGLTMQERERLFDQTIDRGMWQAVKPLVEFSDDLGRRHRDTALEKATAQHQWDVVDYCQTFKADINRHKEYDDNPLQTAAKNEDWEAVEEIVCRDGDQSKLDRQGLSVLHRAIQADQWHTVKKLVQYQANLHLKETNSSAESTPLQKLIDKRQGDVIDLSLMWSPDLHKGESSSGETTLHAVCEAGWLESMYYLVARGVDPLKVTDDGESVLVYAVKHKIAPQTMLAECIKLGFSAHQPSLTSRTWNADRLQNRLCGFDAFVSPMEHAVYRNMAAICVMLYESGACTNSELFTIRSQLQKIQTANDMSPEVVATAGEKEAMANYIERVATTPRTLLSACCIAVSKCLNVRGKRLDTAGNVILFSHVTGPQFCCNAAILDEVLADVTYAHRERSKVHLDWLGDLVAVLCTVSRRVLDQLLENY